MNITEQDIKHLDSLYQNRRAFHGELHDHSASGGTSDGKRPLMHWLGAMEVLKLHGARSKDLRQSCARPCYPLQYAV